MNKSTNNLLPMRFDNKEIDIKKPWGDDGLGREKFANVLTDRIQNGASPYTISVSGDWGTGKTFILRRWQQQLENEGYKAIYYNAWEDDFCNNPLVSIIGQIAIKIKDNSFKKLISHVKKIAAPLLVKKAFNHVYIDPKDLKSEINNTIDEYSKEIAQIKELKESLETLTAKIEKDTGHPLIFIIDELDRCRPTFAIEILERIKHLFNIPGIIFVLGMNRAELEKSIKHVYGDINSKDYLRRFFDIDLALSAPKSSNYYLHLIKVYQHVLSDHIDDKNHEAYLFDYLDISLRDTEYCFRALCFILNTKISYNKRQGWMTACLILILLRITKYELYWNFIQQKNQYINVINYICELIPNINKDNTKLVDHIIIKEIYALTSTQERDTIVREAENYTHTITNATPNLAQRSLSGIWQQGMGYFRMPYEDNTLQEIASLLDLVEH